MTLDSDSVLLRACRASGSPFLFRHENSESNGLRRRYAVLHPAKEFHTNGANHASTFVDQIESFSRKHICSHFSLCCKDIVNLMQSWRLGCHGQCCEYWQEIARRVWLAVSFVFRFTTSLIPWIFGQFIQSITHCSRKDFTFLRPAQDVVIAEPRELKVLTYNACLGPEWMVAANLLPPVSQRGNDVAHAILRRDPDIVCLQEVFDEDAAEHLKEQLRFQGYSYFVYNAGPSWWKLSSGLFIASKYPIKDPAFWNHQVKSGWDSYSNKGTLAVTVQIGSKNVFVFNTHFNGPAPAEDEARIGQMRGFLDQIDSYCSLHPTPKRVIACGDFNEVNLDSLSPGFNQRYFDIPAQGESGTLFNMENGDPNTGWNKDRLDLWTVQHGAIDHIFSAQPDNAIEPDHASIYRMDGSSDHLGVGAFFTLSNANPIA